MVFGGKQPNQTQATKTHKTNEQTKTKRNKTKPDKINQNPNPPQPCEIGMNYIVTVVVQIMFCKLLKGDAQVWVYIYTACQANFI